MQPNSYNNINPQPFFSLGSINHFATTPNNIIPQISPPPRQITTNSTKSLLGSPNTGFGTIFSMQKNNPSQGPLKSTSTILVNPLLLTNKNNSHV